MLRKYEVWSVRTLVSWVLQQAVHFNSLNKHVFHGRTLSHYPNSLSLSPWNIPYVTFALTSSASNCTIMNFSMQFVFFHQQQGGRFLLYTQIFEREGVRKEILTKQNCHFNQWKEYFSNKNCPWISIYISYNIFHYNIQQHVTFNLVFITNSNK